MANFYHIYLKPNPGTTEKEIEEKIDLALDWYKYSANCWIVRSTSDVDKWQTRLKPLAKEDGFLLIMKVDPHERQGWMPKGFWDWLKNARDKN